MRRSRTSTALENVAFGYVTIAITIVQGILLVPLYLHAIPLELYGAWLATGNVLAWIELADPGVSSVLQQRVAFAAGRGDPRSLAPIVGTGLLLTVAFAFVPLAALPLASSVGDWVNLPSALQPELAVAFRIGVASVALSLASQGLNSINIGLQRVRAAGVVLTVSMILGVAVTVAGLLAGWGLLAIPLGSAMRSAAALLANAVVLLFWARRESVVPWPSRGELGALLGTTTYSFVSRIGVAVLTRADAFLSARFLSPASTVTLTLTGRAIDVMRLATDRVGIAVMPVVANLAGERGVSSARGGARVVTRWVAAISAVLVGVSVAWNEHFVRLWVGPEHFGGRALTLLLASYAGLAAVFSALGQILFAVGAIRTVAALGLAEACVRLVAVFVWVPLIGLTGFPAAALTACLLASAALVPRAMAASFGAGARAEYFAMARDAAMVGAFAAAGIGITLLLPAGFAPGWVGLAFSAAVTGAVFGAAAGFLDPVIASEVVRRVRVVRARISGAEG